MMTLGVIKNIIPAIASTNALIAAVCTNEAFKISTGSSPNLDNYFYYKGMTTIGSETYQSQKMEDCNVCSTKPICVKIGKEKTLQQLLDKVSEINKLENPSIETDQGTLLNPIIASTLKNLELPLQKIIENKDYVEGSKMYIAWVREGKRYQLIVGVKFV